MSRTWITATGLVLLAVSALGIFIDRRPHPAGSTAGFTAERSAGLTLSKEARELPDVGFVDGDGRPVKLSSFRGKVVLLNVWATWCAPCREEMPALDRLQARLGGPAFEVIALSIDRDRLPAVKEFYLQTGIKELSVYVDVSGQASSELRVTGIPTTLLIDERGREIGRKIGAAEWDSPEVIALIRRHLGSASASDDGAKRLRRARQ